MEETKNIKSLLSQEQWEASFFEIVEQYSERLLYCAMGILKSESLAQDALQEGMINIWEKPSQVQGQQPSIYLVLHHCSQCRFERVEKGKATSQCRFRECLCCTEYLGAKMGQ